MYGTFTQIETDTTKIRSGVTRRLKHAMHSGQHIFEEQFFIVQLPTSDDYCNHITGLVIDIVFHFFRTKLSPSALKPFAVCFSISAHWSLRLFNWALTVRLAICLIHCWGPAVNTLITGELLSFQREWLRGSFNFHRDLTTSSFKHLQICPAVTWSRTKWRC